MNISEYFKIASNRISECSSYKLTDKGKNKVLNELCSTFSNSNIKKFVSKSVIYQDGYNDGSTLGLSEMDEKRIYTLREINRFIGNKRLTNATISKMDKNFFGTLLSTYHGIENNINNFDMYDSYMTYIEGNFNIESKNISVMDFPYTDFSNNNMVSEQLYSMFKYEIGKESWFVNTLEAINLNKDNKDTLMSLKNIFIKDDNEKDFYFDLFNKMVKQRDDFKTNRFYFQANSNMFKTVSLNNKFYSKIINDKDVTCYMTYHQLYHFLKSSETPKLSHYRIGYPTESVLRNTPRKLSEIYKSDIGDNFIKWYEKYFHNCWIATSEDKEWMNYLKSCGGKDNIKFSDKAITLLAKATNTNSNRKRVLDITGIIKVSFITKLNGFTVGTATEGITPIKGNIEYLCNNLYKRLQNGLGKYGNGFNNNGELLKQKESNPSNTTWVVNEAENYDKYIDKNGKSTGSKKSSTSNKKYTINKNGSWSFK